MHFIPSTIEEEKELLTASGVASFSDLVKIIPPQLRLKNDVGIGHPLSELEIETELQQLSQENQSDNICFLGDGIYDHFIPKAVDFLCSRSEYYTAYSPYQAEVSQGTLQFLYEFQTMICELSGMDIANASLYDGASAIAEACLLALSVTRKSTILYSSLLNAPYIHVMQSYLSGKDVNIVEIPMNNGITDLDQITSNIDDLAAVIIQSPNTLGLLENWELTKKNIAGSNSLLIAVGAPIALSVLKPPGECGADIYTGEGQTLGNPMSYGGPLLGLMAIKEKYKRRMPGRIIGKTVDKKKNIGFVLTLQTREQHIRREKATSNICTNQGLLALRATIYLSLMGKSGLPYISRLCYQKAQYAAAQISELKNFSLKYGKEILKEFVVETSSSAKKIVDYCLQKGILIQCVNRDEDDSLILIAVTEKRTKEEIDKLVEILKECQ